MTSSLAILIIFGVALLAVNVFAVWYITRLLKGKGSDETAKTGFEFLQKEIQNLRTSFDTKMGDTTKTMHEAVRTQFSESQKLIRDINKEVNEQLRSVVKGVTEVSESSKQVFTVAEQLQNLEKVLKHQKQRGNLGEASLQLALENILPASSFKMQYEFPGGETVDAVIITKDGMIPIDAKFSLDNYRRLADENDDERRVVLEKEFKNDLKKRIDETAKYIRPKDGTLPFAFMYIPAEAIYYDLLVNEVGSVKVNTRSLIDYAYKDKNIIIVSPTTFAAYLQSVLYGFRAFQIEESAKEIRKRVEELGRHIGAYDSYYKKLGNSLSTTVNHYNAGYKELGKIDKDVLRITEKAPGVEIEQIERPATGE
ncbi:MAG: DNA recombination protein RmuC [bacterium]|nr:DNA recombination protein RmuC [bacterium]